MKYSLGLWLSLCLVGLQSVAVIFVVWSSYVTSERVLLDHARGLLSDVGVNTTAHAQGFLGPAQGAAELAARLAENKIVSSDNRQLLEQLLFQQLQTAPQFAAVFYGDETGNFVYVSRGDGAEPFQSKLISHDLGVRQTQLIWRGTDFGILARQQDQSDTYDPRTRPWYEDAKDARGSIWTDPYIFFSSQRPGITIAAPVIGDEGTVRGVVGVDIEITAISEFLSHLQIGESGSALIANQNGDVIAHPQPELLKAENDDGTFRFVSITEIADPIAQNAFGQVSQGEDLSVEQENYTEFVHDGEAYVSMVMPIISPELPWTIVIYAPERDFIGAIKQNRYLNVWIAVATVLATGLAGLILANVIYRPVRAFAVRTALVSQGEVDPSEALPRTYKELDQANQALTKQIRKRKQSEREYGLTFDMASRGMAQMDAKTGMFLRVNARFAEILGYEPDELFRQNPVDLTHPDDATLSWDFNPDDVDQQTIDFEKRFIRKDGQPVWVKINAIIIRDNNGKPLHTVATIDDITEAHAADEQIQKLNRDLSHMARGELLGQMAAGLAHELNQPLTAITQNADAALMTIQDRDANQELSQILQDLDQQAHRAGDIIKALREFAHKGEEGKAPFDLNKLLGQSLRLVQAEAKEHGATINVKHSNLPEVSGIRVQIAQVIVNLLRNGIESIAASDNNSNLIQITSRVVRGFVEVAVEDSGAGVDPSIDLFGQFETTKSDGMGLGLSICRSIIQAGGGQLYHDETYMSGARFCFTVPISD